MPAPSRFHSHFPIPVPIPVAVPVSWLRLRLSVGCDADHASAGSAPVPFAGIWEAMEKLNTLVDESDPDVSILPPISMGASASASASVRSAI